MMLRAVLTEEVPRVAVSVAVTVAVTGVEVMGNVVVRSPAGTVTVAGTMTSAELLVRLTTSPPLAAAEARRTVP
jgi:hypothetical protein